VCIVAKASVRDFGQAILLGRKPAFYSRYAGIIPPIDLSAKYWQIPIAFELILIPILSHPLYQQR